MRSAREAEDVCGLVHMCMVFVCTDHGSFVQRQNQDLFSDFVTRIFESPGSFVVQLTACVAMLHDFHEAFSPLQCFTSFMKPSELRPMLHILHEAF